MPYELAKSFTVAVDPAANVIAANRFLTQTGGVAEEAAADADPIGISGEAAVAATASMPAKNNINAYALMDGSMIEVECGAAPLAAGAAVSVGAAGVAVAPSGASPIIGWVVIGGAAGEIISIRVARAARVG